MIEARTVDYLRALASAVDAKGGYFPGHSDAVAYIATLYATELQISGEDLALLHCAAMLHDTGKIKVPDNILMAPRQLSPTEWVVMRQHSIWSAEIAESIDGMHDVAKWVRHHHERYDGMGYPDGLKGKDIPWQSRLLLIADAFHVMTATRPYKTAMTRTEALDVLYDNAGTQFDPQFVEMVITHAAKAN